MNQIKHSATSRVTPGLANWPERVWRPPVINHLAAFLVLRFAGVSPAQRNCARSGVADDAAFGCERALETSAETGSSTAKTPIFLAHSFSSFGRFLLFLFTVFT